MLSLIARYTSWLHTRWPAGTVEKLPVVNEDGSTKVPGLYIVGDLTGVPLLKFAADTGAKAVATIATDPAFAKRAAGNGEPVVDLIIVGAGVAGMAAALEAKKLGLSFTVVEASEPFSTIANFPKAKPIFTFPTEMTPTGDLQFSEAADVKEALLDELMAQVRAAGIEPMIARVERVSRRGDRLEVVVSDGDNLLAHRVIVAIGRSGNYRKLGVDGEDLDKVLNRLHDPKDYCDSDVLVVGGGDSALETAIAIAECGGRVTLSYRKASFSRAKPDNIDKVAALSEQGSLRVLYGSAIKEIRESDLVITRDDGERETLPNDAVFAMIGREPPLDFFRRSGVPIGGEWRALTWAGFAAFMCFCIFLYHWKKDAGLPINQWFAERGWFPFNVPAMFDAVGGTFAEAAGSSTNLLYTLKHSMADGGFYYTLAYCLCVVIFGIRRIKRRKTPYVKVQTLTLMAIQCFPLFILPELLLPWAGRNGWFADGSALCGLADQFFDRYDAVGMERAYWRSYGFVLAWPLFVWNLFTQSPIWGWVIVGTLQTFVVIPLMVWRWGKGAYCGWVCSCGALAETLGDTHRHKMPHGLKWNHLNMVGQVILAIAFLLMVLRVLGWVMPGSAFATLHIGLLEKYAIVNYKWAVDLMLAGVVGVGCYFWFSGRVWCRFACPLAALMHIYARFSRYRILADKKKCISCNVCTSVCHQGIDIMNFANKGRPMEDPECVRCSACVQSCPTGVLTFGQVDRATGDVLATDRLAASPVQMLELTVNGRPH